MPVRNGERYIRHALDSLLAQTFSDFELIIRDNHSTDNTEEICRGYADRDPRICYARNPRDVGPAENYNRCFRQARGQYFKWAAHDDVLLPTYLEKCIRVLDSDPTVVNCHTRTRIIDEHGNPIEDYPFRTTTSDRRAHRRFGPLINSSHRRHAGFEIFGVMRRDVMATVPEQGAYAHADRVFLVRMSLRGRFHEIDEPLFLSRRHASQSMAAKPQHTLRDRLARYVGHGPLPPPEWWDESLKGKVVFPDWRLLREYCSSIGAASLDPVERFRCRCYLGLWLVKYWPKLARDVVFAGERLVSRRGGARPQEIPEDDALAVDRAS
jgi:glycosyltransferase involved in cell wall biosynthesis